MDQRGEEVIAITGRSFYFACEPPCRWHVVHNVLFAHILVAKFLGCFLPGKVICLPDPKIQDYPVLTGKSIFTVFLPGKKSKSKLILRQ